MSINVFSDSRRRREPGRTVGGDGEGQADVHAAGVVLDRGVDEALHFGKGDDLVEAAVDPSAPSAGHGFGRGWRCRS